MNYRYKDNFTIGPSSIHGTGVFADKFLSRKKLIGVGIYFVLFIVPIVTEDLGRWLNHSYEPNSKVCYHRNSKYYIVAIQDINKGDEITINYNDTPWYILGPGKNFI